MSDEDNKTDANDLWAEAAAENNLTQSALSFGDQQQTQIQRRKHNSFSYEQSWQNEANDDGAVDNQNRSLRRTRQDGHENNDQEDETGQEEEDELYDDYEDCSSYCQLLTLKLVFYLYTVLGLFLIGLGSFWIHQLLTKASQSSASQSASSASQSTLYRLAWILVTLGACLELRALILSVGLRYPRKMVGLLCYCCCCGCLQKSDISSSSSDTQTALSQCFVWLSSRISFVSSLTHLVAALVAVIWKAALQAFVATYFSTTDNNDDVHHLLGASWISWFVQHKFSIVWTVLLVASLMDCVTGYSLEAQFERRTSLHRRHEHDHRRRQRRRLLQDGFMVQSSFNSSNPDGDNGEDNGDGNSWMSTASTRAVRRPWWWKRQQQTGEDGDNTVALTESLLDHHNNSSNGLPSWVSGTSRPGHYQERTGLEASSFWSLFGIHRSPGAAAEDDVRGNDPDFVSVQEEWERRSQQDPFWWSRDEDGGRETNNNSSPSRF